MFGLDISSSSVKLVELGRDKAGNLVLERCAIEPLERGWISDGNIEKFDEVADAWLGAKHLLLDGECRDRERAVARAHNEVFLCAQKSRE